ncbi:MAG: SDR family NAD(P)-dependent oxidoreductase [Bacteroidota bacterium]
MQEKNILIVGGTDGIGKAVALKMAELHYSVTILGRNRTRGNSVLTLLQQRNPKGQHFFIASDLSVMKNVVKAVDHIHQLGTSYDVILHTADVLKVAREETSEGLEVCIATNFYARLMMNDQLVLKNMNKPQKLIHVAAAGFPPGKNFRDKFPVATTASSFTGHGIGQIANDFYGFYAREILSDKEIQVNILNPGMVDTDIRRNGSFPKWFMWIEPVLNLLLKPLITSPEKYAQVVVDIVTDRNTKAKYSVLIDSKGKPKKPSRHLLEEDMQHYIVDTAREEIQNITDDKAQSTNLLR